MIAAPGTTLQRDAGMTQTHNTLRTKKNIKLRQSVRSTKYEKKNANARIVLKINRTCIAKQIVITQYRKKPKSDCSEFTKMNNQ